MNESTPKSPYAKNAFHPITFMDGIAMNIVVSIDVLPDKDTGSRQNKSTIWGNSRYEGFSEWTRL